MKPPDTFLNAIRERLGNPKRSLGWFKPSPLDFPEPLWLKNVSTHDDQTKLLFNHFKNIWKDGVIIWGYIVRANALLYSPGADDSPGLMIFSVTDSDESALEQLPHLAQRLWNLSEYEAPDPKWSEKQFQWWEDLNDDMSYHKGVRLPPEWQNGHGDYKASSVVFHRPHLPDHCIQSRLLPIIIDPLSNIPQIVPFSYWPLGLADHLVKNFGLVETDVFEPNNDILEYLAPNTLDHAEFEDAYTSVFGPIASVLHEHILRPDHIDVFTFHWGDPRNESSYVSGGMSNLLQPDGGEFARIELVFYSKHHDPRFSELIHVFARYPWQTGASLGPWHTVSLHHQAEAVLGTDRFPALLFFPGVAKSETRIHNESVFSASSIRFMTVVPITQAELDLTFNEGIEALIERFRMSRFDLAFDPERLSLV